MVIVISLHRLQTDHADHILMVVQNVLIKLGLNIVPRIPPIFTNAYLVLVSKYRMALNTYYNNGVLTTQSSY